MHRVRVVVLQRLLEAREDEHGRHREPGLYERTQLQDIEQRVRKLKVHCVETEIGRKERMHRVRDQLRVGIESGNAHTREG